MNKHNHNEIIELLCSYAFEHGYGVHVGETEQKKVSKFKNASVSMLTHTQFGLPPDVFKTILEIDVLYLKGSSIPYAFEVATTVETANKAVNDRYRNLFTAMPNLNVKAYLIVKDKDMKKAQEIVYSKANVTDGVSKEITIIPLSDLSQDKFKQFL